MVGFAHAETTRDPDHDPAAGAGLLRRRPDGAGTAQLGHFDRTGGGNTSWNSAHPSKGCSQQGLIGTGGNGYFYCFATN